MKSMATNSARTAAQAAARSQVRPLKARSPRLIPPRPILAVRSGCAMGAVAIASLGLVWRRHGTWHAEPSPRCDVVQRLLIREGRLAAGADSLDLLLVPLDDRGRQGGVEQVTAELLAVV